MEGSGYTEIAGQRFDWEKNDIFVAPNFLCARLAYKILSYRFGDEVRGRRSATFSSGYPAPASHHR